MLGKLILWFTIVLMLVGVDLFCMYLLTLFLNSILHLPIDFTAVVIIVGMLQFGVLLMSAASTHS